VVPTLVRARNRKAAQARKQTPVLVLALLVQARRTRKRLQPRATHNGKTFGLKRRHLTLRS
jgi:hypothetical protein